MTSIQKYHTGRLCRIVPARTLIALGFYLFVLCSYSKAQDQTVQLIQLLSNAPGPPGFEESVRKIMVEHMTSLADHLAYDGLGSIIATQGSSGPA